MVEYYDGLGKGYDWSKGMSVNAVAAYDDGQRPWSRWDKEHLMEEVRFEYEDAPSGASIIQLAEAAPVYAVREVFLAYVCDHHTGKFYRRTSFYEVSGGLSLEWVRDGLTNARLNAARVRFFKKQNGLSFTAVYDDGRTRKEGSAILYPSQKGVVGKKNNFVVFTADLAQGRAMVSTMAAAIPDDMREWVRAGSWGDLSRSGHWYAPRRKPSHWDAEHAASYFTVGERRLTMWEEDGPGITPHGFVWERWTGSEWEEDGPCVAVPRMAHYTVRDVVLWLKTGKVEPMSYAASSCTIGAIGPNV